jgi:hypothetical protein
LTEDVRALALLVARIDEYSELESADDASELAQQIRDKLSDCQNRAATYAAHARMLQRAEPSDRDLEALAAVSAPVTELWLSAAEWASNSARWLATPFRELEAGAMEPAAQDAYERSAALVRRLASHPNPNPPAVSIALRERIATFKQHLPLFVRLGHTGMRPHHWAAISAAAHVDRASSNCFTC